MFSGLQHSDPTFLCQFLPHQPRAEATAATRHFKSSLSPVRSSDSEDPVSTPTQAEKKPPVNVNAASHSLKWSPPNCPLAAGAGIALRAETEGPQRWRGVGRVGKEWPTVPRHRPLTHTGKNTVL